MTDVLIPIRIKYFIDTAAIEAAGRSFTAMAQARFCPACRAKIGEKTQERVTAIDPKTGRVSFSMRETSYGSNPLAVIRADCSRQRNYVAAETPLAEAIFRVFLATGNQPMDVDQIREQLEQFVSPNLVGHSYAADVLERVISGDSLYGLKPFEGEEPVIG